MSARLKSVSVVLSLVFFAACGGGSKMPSSYSVSGQVQKGPLIFGSRIWVSELNSDLNPNGKTYLAQTADDLGNFTVASTVNSNLVELLGMGYYMDELTGSLSTSPITLSAIADLTVDQTPTINILTTLQAPRVKNLILQGKSYSEALEQSQTEVLSAFGIDSSKIDSLQSLYAMSINGTSDQDSALLAASTILAKMSTISATANSSSQAAEMSYYLSRMAAEIATSGSLTSSSIISARNSAATQINLSTVRSNIETYYANRGISMTAPKFEEWIDKDGSGSLPKRRVPATGISPTNFTGAEALQVVSSNEMTVGGLGSGIFSPAVVSFSGALLKNNSVVDGLTSTVVDGDVLTLRRTSGGFGQSITTDISVGSTSTSWVLTTRTPTVNFVSDSGCGPAGYPGDDSSVYHALPIKPSQAISAKYIGVAMPGAGSASISIYSDNSSQPGTAIVTSTNKGEFFPSSLSLPLNGGGSKSNFSGGNHYYLSSSGVSLSANTLYWVVIKFPSVADPGSSNNATVPNGSRRMVSSDGVTWGYYSGQANCRYDDQIPEVWITD